MEKYPWKCSSNKNAAKVEQSKRLTHFLCISRFFSFGDGSGNAQGQVLHDRPGDDEPRHGGHEGQAAGDIPAVDAFALGFGRLDFVKPLITPCRAMK